MEGNMQCFQHTMLYYFKKGKNAAETYKMMCAVYREGAVTDRTSQKWLAKFCPGNFLWDNAPWSGRPAEVDREQIETLTDNNQLSIPQEIVDILKISKSVKLLVKMKMKIFIENTKQTFWPTQ